MRVLGGCWGFLKVYLEDIFILDVMDSLDRPQIIAVYLNLWLS